MRAVCCGTRVPHAGKTRARLNAREKSRRRPDAALLGALRTLAARKLDDLLTDVRDAPDIAVVGSPPDAGVTGLRRVFRDHDVVLHTGFSANSPHQLVQCGGWSRLRPEV